MHKTFHFLKCCNRRSYFFQQTVGMMLRPLHTVLVNFRLIIWEMKVVYEYAK